MLKCGREGLATRYRICKKKVHYLYLFYTLPRSMTKHIYLVYTGEAPYHTSVDCVGGYQGAHYKRRKAIQIATQIHQTIRDTGIKKALTLVIQSPAGVWTDGLFNLKHFYKGADRDTTPHMVVHSLYADKPAVDGPPPWRLLHPDRRLPGGPSRTQGVWKWLRTRKRNKSRKSNKQHGDSGS